VVTKMFPGVWKFGNREVLVIIATERKLVLIDPRQSWQADLGRPRWPTSIVADRFDVRETLAELAASIKSQGVLQLTAGAVTRQEIEEWPAGGHLSFTSCKLRSRK
jgi:hypothetical protein